MNIEMFTDLALDTPFLEKGRSYVGWDCWGLIYVAYKEIFNVDLPLYTDGYKSTRRREELQSLISKSVLGNWEKVEEYIPGDVAVVRMLGRDCHVGLMLKDRHILHVQERVGVVIENLDQPPWKDKNYDKLEGIYHYVS